MDTAKDHLNSEYLYKTQIVMQHVFDNFSTNMKRFFNIVSPRFGLRNATNCDAFMVLRSGWETPFAVGTPTGVCNEKMRYCEQRQMFAKRKQKGQCFAGWICWGFAIVNKNIDVFYACILQTGVL